MGEQQTKRREDLIGQTGSITRQIEVLDAKESVVGGVKVVDVRISDSVGNEYWTTLDEDISLD